MMRFLENRAVAWCVLALCVVLSISLYGGGAMKDMRFSAQQIFADGIGKDGLSISRDLDVRADSAYSLASIASKYLSEEDEAYRSVMEASGALSQADALAERHDANFRLTRAVEDLYTRLEASRGLSAEDKTGAYSLYKEIKSRADTISRDMYNSEARKFNQSLSVFLASLIARFTGVEPLPLFE